MPISSNLKIIRDYRDDFIANTRRPFLREPHELSLQIVNPGGEQSNVYQLTTP